MKRSTKPTVLRWFSLTAGPLEVPPSLSGVIKLALTPVPNHKERRPVERMRITRRIANSGPRRRVEELYATICIANIRWWPHTLHHCNLCPLQCFGFGYSGI